MNAVGLKGCLLLWDSPGHVDCKHDSASAANQMLALQAKDDKCQKEKEEHVSGTLDGVEKVPKHNETALAQVICLGFCAYKWTTGCNCRSRRHIQMYLIIPPRVGHSQGHHAAFAVSDAQKLSVCCPLLAKVHQGSELARKGLHLQFVMGVMHGQVAGRAP